MTPAAATIKAKITGEDVVDGSLTGADIQDRSLTGDDVAGGSIDGFNIALDTLVGGHVLDDSLTSLDVQNFSLAGIDVAPSSISGGHILDNNVTGDDIDESTLASNDAHDFFNPECDPHSTTFIECGTVSFTLGHAMPVIAFWNYGYGSENDDDISLGTCQTRVDGATTGEVSNQTYEDPPGPFSSNGHYGATPIVDVLQFGAGTHTVSLWCHEPVPEDHDFVVFDLRIAVVELGLD